MMHASFTHCIINETIHFYYARFSIRACSIHTRFLVGNAVAVARAVLVFQHFAYRQSVFISITYATVDIYRHVVFCCCLFSSCIRPSPGAVVLHARTRPDMFDSNPKPKYGIE